MGMKIQSKSYLPGFFSMRDFNEESNAGSWSLFYEDRLSKNGRCYNGFTPGPLHENTDYDKKILRQTMLRQETIFRKQVFELHRLYRVQRNLMNEIPKDVHKCPLQNVIAQPISFSSHMPSTDAQIILQPNLAITSSSSGGSFVPAAENGRTSLSFLQERSKFLCSELKRLPKRPFDLHLPADEYIDIKDGLKNEEKIAHQLPCEKTDDSSKIGSEKETETKLTLGAQSERKYDLLLENNAHFVADLNEPVQENETTNGDNLASVELVGPISSNRYIQVKEPSAALGLPKDFFKDNDNFIDSKKIQKLPHTEDEDRRIEWLSYKTKPDHSSDKSLPLYDPMQAEPKAPDLLPFLFNRNESDRHFMQKLVPEDNNENLSLSASSWRKRATSTTRVPIAVQALSCFKELASVEVMNKTSSTAETWNLNRRESSVSGFGSDASSSQSFHHTSGLYLGGSHSEHSFSAFDKRVLDSGYSAASGRPRKCLKGTDCADVTSAKEMNLNFSFPNGLHNGVCANNIPLFANGEATVRSLPGGPAWLKAKPDNLPSEVGVCSVKDPSFPFTKSSSHINCEDVHKPEVADGPYMRKMLGCSLLNNSNDNLSQFSLSSVLSKQKIRNSSNGENDCDTKLPYRRAWLESSTQFLEDEMLNVRSTKGISFRLDINLNATVATCTEQRNQLEFSTQNAMDVSTSDAIKASVKTKAHIDLEAPVTENMVTWEDEYKISNKFIVPKNLQHSQMKDLEVTLMQSAAESIMAISAMLEKLDEHCFPPLDVTCSASVYNKFNESCSSSQDLLKEDSLLWFADLVCNEASNPEGITDQSKLKIGIDHEQLDEDSDHFEEMTLRLSEVDVSEYYNKSWERDNSNEVTGLASLLSRPRKGNSRRGRQRRDFQKDILPGLASLSRHEVTEDVHTIEALLRDAGNSWQMGHARRNARNRGTCQTRGRRRLRGSNLVNFSPPRQPSISEMELEGLGLQGWGKTTRRARRQRYPTVNVTSLLT